MNIYLVHIKTEYQHPDGNQKVMEKSAAFTEFNKAIEFIRQQTLELSSGTSRSVKLFDNDFNEISGNQAFNVLENTDTSWRGGQDVPLPSIPFTTVVFSGTLSKHILYDYILRESNDDLSGDEREKYASHLAEEIDGTTYVAHHLHSTIGGSE